MLDVCAIVLLRDEIQTRPVVQRVLCLAHDARVVGQA